MTTMRMLIVGLLLLTSASTARASLTPPLCLPDGAPAVYTTDAGLHLYARLEEASGTRIDSSARANHLTPFNAPGSSADRQEGAASLDLTAASSQYVQRDSVNLAAGFPGNSGGGNTALTVAGWLKLKSAANQPLVMKVGADRSWSFWVWNFGGGPVFDPNLWDSAGNPSNGDFAGTTALQVGQWYHFAWTFSSASGQSLLYLNGALEAGPYQELNAGATMFRGTAPLALGVRPGQGIYADALLDEVLVLDRALSAAEVASVYQYGVVDAGTLQNCDDGNLCSDDSCTPLSGCQHVAGNAGATCRAANGVCDVAETCDGVGIACPADGFASSGTCRASAGACDAADSCDGSGPDCPADGKLANGTICRGTAGACDVAETCDGASDTCPADGFASSGTCRPPAGACDLADACDGSGPDCPADAKVANGTTCRGPAGACDVAEACDGVGDACPADGVKIAGTPCRPAAGVCDLAESCDGLGKNCPADAFQPNGTDCADALFCNGAEECQGGACTAPSPACAPGESCDEAGDLCFAGECPTTAVSCATAEKDKLLVKQHPTDDGRDKLVWKWSKGQASLPADFADPTATATYALCVYAGPGAALIGQAGVAPSATLWSPIGSKGFNYKNAAGNAAGITRVKVKASPADLSQALVVGKGANLPDLTLPIAAGDLPLIVQLRNGDTGKCWGSTFATARKNDVKQFNAKAP